ncbi:hypothetical protein [Mycoplasma sp. 1018B]|uniref:hypothetical protein n=1 Tax=Mycoplasma sp. 1018B TaxID=2967302 RepID=UPI00211C8090|nr:hypothetical protein [Mycoplasma sp. 1018B]UUM19269.1 hypothetical protein NPA14_00075 [Mycoplasma sp. 1018B]
MKLKIIKLTSLTTTLLPLTIIACSETQSDNERANSEIDKLYNNFNNTLNLLEQEYKTSFFYNLIFQNIKNHIASLSKEQNIETLKEKIKNYSYEEKTKYIKESLEYLKKNSLIKEFDALKALLTLLPNNSENSTTIISLIDTISKLFKEKIETINKLENDKDLTIKYIQTINNLIDQLRDFLIKNKEIILKTQDIFSSFLPSLNLNN